MARGGQRKCPLVFEGRYCRRRPGRALRNRAVSRLGPADAGRSLSGGRRSLHHRSSTRHPRACRLFRSLAGDNRILQPRARAHGTNPMGESCRTDRNCPGCVCNCLERYSLSDTRRDRRGNCLRHRQTPAHTSPCRWLLVGFVAAFSLVLFLGAWIQVESSAALVARRHPWRRAAAALAGFAADGRPAPYPGLRSGNLRHRISSLRICRFVARLSGFLPRIAPQHFSGSVDQSRSPGPRSAAGPVRTGRLGRAPSPAPPRSSGSAASGRPRRQFGLPAVWCIHRSNRTLLLSLAGNSRSRRHSPGTAGTIQGSLVPAARLRSGYSSWLCSQSGY